MEKYDIGYTAEYINDHKFDHLTDIPVTVAVEWVQKVAPEVNMGNNATAEELTIGGDDDTNALENGWLNKLFVIVAHEHGNFLALYNHDGVFSLRVQT